jgi:hypothetical protein
VEVDSTDSRARDASSDPTATYLEKLADSALITRKFIDDGTTEDLNAALLPTERAKDLAVRALLEDKLYFY